MTNKYVKKFFAYGSDGSVYFCTESERNYLTLVLTSDIELTRKVPFSAVNDTFHEIYYDKHGASSHLIGWRQFKDFPAIREKFMAEHPEFFERRHFG